MRIAAALLFLTTSVLVTADETVVFVDGTRMPILSYEVDGAVVRLVTTDGELQSVPRSYVDLDATAEVNAQKRRSRPRTGLATETVTVERPIAQPKSESVVWVAERSPAEPPPPWTSDALQVSLQIPSSEWTFVNDDGSAVSLSNPLSDATATLTALDRPLHKRSQFEELVEEIVSIVEAKPHRPLSGSHLALDPYSAYEIRFATDDGEEEIYHRWVVVYSKDRAYWLRLACRMSLLASSSADFDAFVLGLVIRKPREEIVF